MIKLILNLVLVHWICYCDVLNVFSNWWCVHGSSSCRFLHTYNCLTYIMYFYFSFYGRSTLCCINMVDIGNWALIWIMIEVHKLKCFDFWPNELYVSNWASFQVGTLIYSHNPIQRTLFTFEYIYIYKLHVMFFHFIWKKMKKKFPWI